MTTRKIRTTKKKRTMTVTATKRGGNGRHKTTLEGCGETVTTVHITVTTTRINDNLGEVTTREDMDKTGTTGEEGEGTPATGEVEGDLTDMGAPVTEEDITTDTTIS